MITRGIRKRLSIFILLCILITNFNVSFSINVQENQETQPVSNGLSVTQEVYSTQPVVPTFKPVTVTQAVYMETSSTPAPTVTESVYSTPAPTVTESIYNTPAPTVIESVYCKPVPTVTESVYSTPAPTVIESVYCTPIAVVTPSPASQDIDDYGDDIQNAFAISADATTSGKLGSSESADVFYFSSDVEVDTIISIKYSNCLAASILEFAGNEVSANSGHGSGTISLGVHALKNVKYYIKLWNIHQEPSNYTVNVIYMIDDYSGDKTAAKDIKVGQLISGNFIDDADVDYFKITTAEKGVYKINSTDCNYGMVIDDSNGDIITTSNNFINLDANKTYFLKVSKYVGIPNNFNYGFQIAGPILDDFGNSKELAQEIQLNKEVKGRINYSKDSDFFSFKPSSNGEYFIDEFTSADIDGNIYKAYLNRVIRIFNSNGKELGFYCNYTNSSAHFSLIKDNTYYISISTGDSFYISDYSFIIKGPMEDDFGNTTETACEIQLGKQVTGATDYLYDSDFFIFKPTVDGAYYLEDFVTAANGERYTSPATSMVLMVYESTSNYTITSFNNGSSLYYYLSKDRVYYIYITNKNVDSLFRYSFSFKGITTDDYGNTKESAAEIKLNTKLEGVGNYYCDSDFFCYKPSVDGAYYIEKSTSSSVNILFQVIDENSQDVLVYSYNSNQQFNLKKDTRYYIYTTFVNCFSPICYSFVLKGPIADDYGNTKEVAHEIQANTLIEGDINYSYDKDFFSFTPAVDGEYYIGCFSSSDNKKVRLSSDLKILDADENNLNTFYYDSYLNFRLEKGKKYYLSISNDNCMSTMFCYSFMLKGPIVDDYGNTKESAVEIKADNPVNGYINSNDTDCFSFKPSVEGIYKIDTYYIESSKPLSNVMSFYDKDGNFIKRYSNSQETDFYLCKDTLYYIFIAPNENSPSQFYYKLKLTGPKEDDYCNINQSAKEIKMDTKVEGRFEYRNDIDCFSFIPSVDGRYYLEGLQKSFAKNYLYISDSYGKKVLYGYSSGSAYFYLTKDTTYYFTLDCTNNYSNSSYWFKVGLLLADDYGNNRETAKEIQLDNNVEGLADTQNDCDYFSFKPLEAGTYYIDNYTAVDNNNSNINRNISEALRVIDSDDNILMPQYDHRSHKRAYINMSKGKTYYIYIINSDVYLCFNYSFVLKGPIVDDYGNSKEAAEKIQLDKEVKGSINNVNDCDCFSFEPFTTGIYYLDNYIVNSADGYYASQYMEVMDSYGTPVSIETCGDTKYYFSLTEGKKYYVCIKNENIFSMFNYKFTLKGPIVDDFADSPSEATTLEIGNAMDGIIDYCSDRDVFSFTTKEEGLYSITTEGTNPVNIILFDKYCNEVPVSFYNRVNSMQYYRLMPNRPYYIRLWSERITDLNYSVCVNGPIIDDYGNFQTNGTIVKLGDTGITIDYQGDVDVLKFVPSITGKYYFKISGNTNSAIDLYSYFGVFIEGSYVDAETVSCNLTAHSAINIAINEDGKLALGNYTITISKPLVQNTFKITGYIKPDFINSPSSPLKAGFIVALEGTQLSAVSDETGYFEIKDIPTSDKGFDITITKESYLKRELNNIVVSGNVSLSLPESPMEMWPGDMGESRDGAINIKDIIQIAECFNSIKGDSRYMENMDVDCNSVINILDIMLVSKHFNKSTGAYPN